MTPIGRQTVTIVRTPGRDHFGDPIEGEPVEVDVPGCSIQPDITAEATAGRDTVTTTLTAWLPPGTDVRATDHIRYEGQLYSVDGQPRHWADVHGRSHHVEVRLRRVDG